VSPHPLADVVALDIDGNLADYHGAFTEFAEKWTGRKMPDPTHINPGLPLYKHLHMSRENYRQAKLAFRQGGWKRWMACYPYSRELTVHIRKKGVQVWICTSRPYLRLDNVDPDTRHWLRRNRIQYDGVVFGEDKYKQLARIVGIDRILMVVDDLPEQIDKANALGLLTVIRNQPYNKLYYGAKYRAFNNYDTQEIFDDCRRRTTNGH